MTSAYTYYDNGSLQSVLYGDGSREDYTFTSDNLLQTLINRKADNTIIDSYVYTYDAAHNLLTKTDSRGITSYTYDVLNRLSSVTEPSGKVTSYTYDASGNRATQTVVLGTDTTITTYTYDPLNRLLGTVTQLNGITTETVAYTYDNNGNQLLQTHTATINGIPQTPIVKLANTYDLFNQLITTVTSDGVTVISTYNGDGLRVGKSVNGTLTRYLYEYQRVVLEENYLGDQIGRNVYGINLLTRQVGGDILIYMYNGHADVTALLNTAGSIVATYYYDAFGNILDQTGVLSNNILYAGYQYDSETGLYYLNARMYDPVTARFMQEDTFTGDRNDPLSLNLYTYCHNEPLMYSDPTGHSAQGWEPPPPPQPPVIKNIEKMIGILQPASIKMGDEGRTARSLLKNLVKIRKSMAGPAKPDASNEKEAKKEHKKDYGDYFLDALSDVQDFTSGVCSWFSDREDDVNGFFDNAMYYYGKTHTQLLDAFLPRIEDALKSDPAYSSDPYMDDPQSSYNQIKNGIIFTNHFDIGIMNFVADTTKEATQIVVRLGPARSLFETTNTVLDVVNHPQKYIDEISYVLNNPEQAASTLGNNVNEYLGSIKQSALEMLSDPAKAGEFSGYLFAFAFSIFAVRGLGALDDAARADSAIMEGTGETNNAVIGKMDDLVKPGAIKPNEYTIAEKLPDLKNPKANYLQNMRELRIEMSRRVPIRDITVNKITGELINNTGFLRAERMEMGYKGWTYNPSTQYWYPPTIS